MWLFTREGFFCFGTTDETPENRLEVRTGNRSDLERLKRVCPSVQEIEIYDGPLKGSDYRFRAIADSGKWSNTQPGPYERWITIVLRKLWTGK